MLADGGTFSGKVEPQHLDTAMKVARHRRAEAMDAGAQAGRVARLLPLAEVFQHVAQSLVGLAEVVDDALGVFQHLSRQRGVAGRDVGAGDVERRAHGARDRRTPSPPPRSAWRATSQPSSQRSHPCCASVSTLVPSACRPELVW